MLAEGGKRSDATHGGSGACPSATAGSMPLPVSFGQVRVRENSAPLTRQNPEHQAQGSVSRFLRVPVWGRQEIITIASAHQEVQHLQGVLASRSVHEVLYGGDCQDSGRRPGHLRRQRLLHDRISRILLARGFRGRTKGVDDGAPNDTGRRDALLHRSPAEVSRLTGGPSTASSSLSRHELSGRVDPRDLASASRVRHELSTSVGQHSANGHRPSTRYDAAGASRIPVHLEQRRVTPAGE